MVAISWLLLIGAVGGVLAVIDGIMRVRGRGTSILGVVEIIAAALFVLSLFVPNIPFGSVALAVVTLIVLLIAAITGRARYTIAIVAGILLVIWLVLAVGWLNIPGIN